MEIKIQKTNKSAKHPTYATDGSGCFDLYSTNKDHVLVQDGFPVKIGTGLKFEIPNGFAMFVFSRSGHGFNFNTRLSNCVGVIDSDYRGEVMVQLTRDSDDEQSMPLAIMPGDRIAQACIIPVPKVSFVEYDELGETERGEGGFGSTGQA